jgi:hypothetical protein
MKYAILALGLLVTPAVAGTYTKDECVTLEQYFTECAQGPEDDGHCWGDRSSGLAHRIYTLEHKHRLPVNKQTDICYEVCHGDATPQQATQKFCPRHKS